MVYGSYCALANRWLIRFSALLVISKLLLDPSVSYLRPHTVLWSQQRLVKSKLLEASEVIPTPGGHPLEA